jgi:hypothetical protein
VRKASVRHVGDNTLLRLYDRARLARRQAAHQTDRERAGRLADQVAAELRRRQLMP